MSLLHALGPVQTWLGQELEKCGIDAMIYTRYVLSLLLHDSYDYDLQEQENDIFLGWEKGAYKKWGKSKKKCSDLTLEEMKKQAAVQCLRSASDESSGIETLVEELCSRLKDIQSKQDEKIHKKLEGSLSPEADLSPTAKDQVERYYEAFPPLSEKKSKLETTYRNRQDACDITSEAVEELSESVHGLCISNNNIHKTYLAAAEDDKYLDDVHLSELTHFYEVDIDQSMLDPGASDMMQGESRILNMIRQKMFEVQCNTEAKVETLQEPNKAVQRSEYHLWEGQKENLEKRGFVSNDLSKVDGGGGSESEFESEKDEGNIPVPSQVDAFEDPQADLKPLEEDAEKEGHYYGKSELESGKFLPRLKKSGMEKSAQTSLDSQEESAGMLPIGSQNPCLECSVKESLDLGDMENSEVNCRIVEPQEETNSFCSCKAGCQFPAYEDNPVSSGELEEFPVLNTDLQRLSGSQEKQCWWEKALYSPLFPASQCEECYTNAKGENGVGEYQEVKEIPSSEEHLLDFNMVSSVYEARCADDINSGAKPNGFRKKIYSSDSSSSEDTASEGGSEWADPCEEELFSRTQL
ncbi:hypothetical protein Y1Q_0021386 [Alligator mississippiensis]|uniref:Uncharacterized protein n=1 Tax=Alligator mississippiensis TaxID=8496 RepID=A0A151PAE0_ALLMI|nr:hypothetical protein Y1Q_0021386 [Alligator mississippiensis]